MSFRLLPVALAAAVFASATAAHAGLESNSVTLLFSGVTFPSVSYNNGPLEVTPGE